MPRRITENQKKFVAEYLQTGNATESANRVYHVKNRQSANQLGIRNLRSPTVTSYMRKMIDKVGLTDDKIADKLELIVDHATKKKALKHIKVADGLRAIELAVKLKDLEPANKNININVTETDMHNLQKEMEEFNRMMRESKTQ